MKFVSLDVIFKEKWAFKKCTKALALMSSYILCKNRVFNPRRTTGFNTTTTLLTRLGNTAEGETLYYIISASNFLAQLMVLYSSHFQN